MLHDAGDVLHLGAEVHLGSAEVGAVAKTGQGRRVDAMAALAEQRLQQPPGYSAAAGAVDKHEGSQAGILE
jgi:hypothetical protein